MPRSATSTRRAPLRSWPRWLASMPNGARPSTLSSRRPCCERCQEWVGGLSPHFYVGDGTEPVWSEVQAGVFETLALTPRANGTEPTYVRLTLRVCDGCSESNYLTITACRRYVDDKGH